jgi:hypothetical protein
MFTLLLELIRNGTAPGSGHFNWEVEKNSLKGITRLVMQLDCPRRARRRRLLQRRLLSRARRRTRRKRTRRG